MEPQNIVDMKLVDNIIDLTKNQTMILQLIQKMDQDTKEKMTGFHHRLDTTETRMGRLECQFNNLVHGATAQDANQIPRSDGHPGEGFDKSTKLAYLELKETRGRFICPFCENDYAKSYIGKHVSKVCWPKQIRGD